MSNVTIEELMQSFSRESFTSLAAAAGLTVKNNRIQCPFKGCKDHRADRPTNVLVTMGKDGCYHATCYRCGETGRYIDLYMAVKDLRFEEALEQLRGFAPTSPSPIRLRVVPPLPKDDESKLKPAEVARIWNACTHADEQGESYLMKRCLEAAAPADLVRFVTEKHPDAGLRKGATQGRRIAMLLKDVVGQPRGMQIRLAREQVQTDKAKVLALKGSTLAGSFFGSPELVESCGVICVTEGLADTLAVALWAQGAKSTCVVGSPGKNNLRRLAEELQKAGVSVEGRVFALFPQNDRPVNASRREFNALAQLLAAGKANVVWCSVPDEHKDVAKWLEESFDRPTWPPLDVQRALGLAPEDETQDAARLVTPMQSVVPVPARFVVDAQAQDFSTLLSILDDPALRYGIMHRQGTWEYNEMTQRPSFARIDLSSTDWTSLRVGLEVIGRATGGKPLKWEIGDIQEAVSLLARRESFHPVREWLNGLKWDGKQRLETELPMALGLEEYGFEARLLKQWCVSAVARAMKPGCKVDTVLVLVGAQGTMKSTFFSVMGGQWFTDQSFDLHDKDGRMIIHSAWIIEWSELDAMRRSRDADATKAFITQRVDKFRPPYGRDLIEAPRSNVIVGTTNQEDFLSDPTGNRRYWPVRIPRRIDVGRVSALRESLWAEAVSCYVAGDEWHLDVSLEDAAAQHVAHFLEGDAWEAPIALWLKQKRHVDYVRTADALSDALGKPTGQWTRGDEMRAGRVLQAIGWRRVKKRIDDGSGTERPLWVYVPPEPTSLPLFPAGEG